MVRSTLSAETVEQVALLDRVLWIRDMLWEMTMVRVPVVMKTDCLSLRDAVHSLSNVTGERRLTIDVYALREALRTSEVVSLSHVSGPDNLSDGLTKHTRAGVIALRRAGEGIVKEEWKKGVHDKRNMGRWR